jgi:hypothetical protein
LSARAPANADATDLKFAAKVKKTHFGKMIKILNHVRKYEGNSTHGMYFKADKGEKYFMKNDSRSNAIHDVFL